MVEFQRLRASANMSPSQTLTFSVPARGANMVSFFVKTATSSPTITTHVSEDGSNWTQTGTGSVTTQSPSSPSTTTAGAHIVVTANLTGNTGESSSIIPWRFVRLSLVSPATPAVDNCEVWCYLYYDRDYINAYDRAAFMALAV